MLTILLLIPLVVLILLGVTSREHYRLQRLLVLVGVLMQMSVALFLYVHYPASSNGKTLAFEEQYEWFRMQAGDWGIIRADYHVGLDGLSLSMLILTAVVFLLASVASWHVKEKSKGYYALFALLMLSVPACFVVRDYLVFYVFFEFMLLPMYFLIGLWGGERREYAAIKFFIYTLIGSLFILIVFIGGLVYTFDPVATAMEAGLITSPDDYSPSLLDKVQAVVRQQPEAVVHRFDIALLSMPEAYIEGSVLSVGHSLRLWAFWLLVIGFLIKLPAVPFHTWLPDAHVEAPTPISVILAGVLLKVGGYGLFRFAIPMFPDLWQANSEWMAGIAAVSIIYGAMNALAMDDLKKMIAYASVSHMGYVLLGAASMTEEGLQGAIFQMMSHGVLSSGLFLLAGVLYDRTHDRLISHYGGLWQRMPRFSVFSFLVMFASLGMPIFSAFIGEVFTLLGGLRSAWVHKGWVAAAALGIVLSAAYFLWCLRRMFMGEYWVAHPEHDKQLTDVSRREFFLLSFCVLLSVFWGVYPAVLFNMAQDSVEMLLRLIG